MGNAMTHALWMNISTGQSWISHNSPLIVSFFFFLSGGGNLFRGSHLILVGFMNYIGLCLIYTSASSNWCMKIWEWCFPIIILPAKLQVRQNRMVL